MTTNERITKIKAGIQEIARRCKIELNEATECKRMKYPALGVFPLPDLAFVMLNGKQNIQITFEVRLFFSYQDVAEFYNIADCLVCKFAGSSLDTLFGMKTAILNKTGQKGITIDDDYQHDECEQKAQVIQFYLQTTDCL